MPFSNRLYKYSNAHNSPNATNTIFISIASYRDVRCKHTLMDLFNKAEYPNRVYCGVLTQNNSENVDESCMLNDDISDNFRYKQNIRLRNISYTEASGPLKARALICKYLYRDEDYFLMIDSHSMFAKHWDSKLINQLEFLKTNQIERPILTNYTSDTKMLDVKADQIPLLCGIITDSPIPLTMSCGVISRNNFAPGYFIGAGFMFSDGTFIKDIGFGMLDAFNHIFSGEEILYAILAYSHGYNIYNPADNIVFHDYRKQPASYFRDITKRESDIDTLVACLKGEISPSYFKLGNKRTISSYWDKIGFNIYETDPDKKWDLKKRARLCNPLESDIIHYTGLYSDTIT